MDIYIAAHIHAYERTFPIRNNSVTQYVLLYACNGDSLSTQRCKPLSDVFAAAVSFCRVLLPFCFLPLLWLWRFAGINYSVDVAYDVVGTGTIIQTSRLALCTSFMVLQATWRATKS